MEINDYQKATIETAIYPDAGTGNNNELTYLALGLTSEAGEVASNVKKLLRDGLYKPRELAMELGDVCWYISRLAWALGYDMTSILNANYTKLQTRKINNTISGSGDER
jgi:NTP pyrophosphatase (non-canonical NTP hydrolase)